MKIITLILCFTCTLNILIANDSSTYKQMPNGVTIGKPIDSQNTKPKIKLAIAEKYIAKPTTIDSIKFIVKNFYSKNPFLAWGLTAMAIFSIFTGVGKLRSKF